MRHFCIIFFVLISTAALGQDQSLISSAGGNDENQNLKISWSIGEVVSESAAENSMMLTQGFHQPEFSIVSASDDLINLSTTFKLYPNPATEFVNLEIAGEPFEGKASIASINGQEVSEHDISSGSRLLRLGLDHMLASQYILLIKDVNDQIVKTYKIIKK